MSETRSLFNRVMTWTIIGIVMLVALKIALRLLGFVMGLAGMVVGLVMFLLFTVGPLVLLGWVAVKAWQAFARREPAF